MAKIVDIKLKRGKYHPHLIQEEEAEKVMRKLGCAPGGILLMLPKTKFRLVKLEKVRNSLATILKQEMLSAGGDAAVHEKTSRCLVKTTNVLLMGTLKHYQLVIKKMLWQSPPESKALAHSLCRLLFNKSPKALS